MAINFPSTPTLNQTYLYNGVTYTWDGALWIGSGSAPSSALGYTQVYRTSTLVIANTVYTGLTFQALKIDTVSAWNVGNPARIVIPAGKTKARHTITVEWASGGTNRVDLTWPIYRAGVALNYSPPIARWQGTGTAEGGRVVVSPIFHNLTAGDWFECLMLNVGGGTLNIVVHDTEWFA